jgi:hypothetical protein
MMVVRGSDYLLRERAVADAVLRFTLRLVATAFRRSLGDGS